MNCPEDYTIGKTKSEYNDVFTLVFTGAIVRNRGFEPIIAAIKDLNDVEFVVAGKVIHKELLDQMQVLSNVTYKGFLSNEDVLALEGHSDAMVVLYDPKVPQNDFVSPNKFFEAMMFRVPIITNLVPELINDEVGCGIIVDYNNVNQIREAIVRLRDNKELCRRLGNNGRNAYLQKYNWKIMEEELYKIYKYLLGY
jgi:glycosyltransferase involved in cell wall biosynthesis